MLDWYWACIGLALGWDLTGYWTGKGLVLDWHETGTLALGWCWTGPALVLGWSWARAGLVLDQSWTDGSSVRMRAKRGGKFHPPGVGLDAMHANI